MSITPDSADALRALVLGFAFAGLLASTYEALTNRRLGFGLLQEGNLLAAASVPILVFGAPFVIIRAIVGARRGTWPFSGTFVATLVAGSWSLLCGQIVLATAMRLSGA